MQLKKYSWLFATLVLSVSVFCTAQDSADKSNGKSTDEATASTATSEGTVADYKARFIPLEDEQLLPPADAPYIPGILPEEIATLQHGLPLSKKEQPFFFSLSEVAETPPETFNVLPCYPIDTRLMLNYPHRLAGRFITCDGYLVKKTPREQFIDTNSGLRKLKYWELTLLVPETKDEYLLVATLNDPEKFVISEDNFDLLRVRGFFYKHAPGRVGDNVSSVNFPIIFANSIKSLGVSSKESNWLATQAKEKARKNILPTSSKDLFSDFLQTLHDENLIEKWAGKPIVREEWIRYYLCLSDLGSKLAKQIQELPQNEFNPAEVVQSYENALTHSFALKGKVTHIEKFGFPLDAKEPGRTNRIDWEGIYFQEPVLNNVHFRCTMQLDDKDKTEVLILAKYAPTQWIEQIEKYPDLKHSWNASCPGVFFKRLDDAADGKPRFFFITWRVAWYPDTRLGNLGYDYGYFDPQVLKHTVPMRSSEQEGLYKMLEVVEKEKAGELLKLGQKQKKIDEAELKKVVVESKKRELTKKLTQEVYEDKAIMRKINAEVDKRYPLGSDEEKRKNAIKRLVLKEVAPKEDAVYTKEAIAQLVKSGIPREEITSQQVVAEKRKKMLYPSEDNTTHKVEKNGEVTLSKIWYDYPYFTRPETVEGNLVYIKGTVRQAEEVRIVDPWRQKLYGFDRYYELTVFPSDNATEGWAIIVLARELPEGMSVSSSEDYAEEVELGGFFYANKRWSVDPSKLVQRDRSNSLLNNIRPGSPIFITKDLTWLPHKPTPSLFSMETQIVIVIVLFVIGSVICFLLVWIGRKDNKSMRELRKKNIETPDFS